MAWTRKLGRPLLGLIILRLRRELPNHLPGCLLHCGDRPCGAIPSIIQVRSPRGAGICVPQAKVEKPERPRQRWGEGNRNHSGIKRENLGTPEENRVTSRPTPAADLPGLSPRVTLLYLH